VSAALQIYYSAFDAAFFKLPPSVRARIEAKIDELGLRLESFPHHRLAGTNRYRLRVGDYGSSTALTRGREFSTCWLWAIAARFTDSFENSPA
jgi:hypothetical protein